MGLCIEFVFEDGSNFDVSLCYRSFSGSVMCLDDMKRWGFKDYEGEYTGPALNFLIDCLFRAGYLLEPFEVAPVKAVFC